MKKGGKIALGALIAVAVGVIGLIAVNRVQADRRAKAWAEAKALYDAGQYEAASEAYDKLGDVIWLAKCGLAIAERDARALYDGGEPEAALALLRQDAPESELRAKLAEEYAVSLVEKEDYEAALAVLRGDAPESESIARCEGIVAQIAEEQAFRTAALEGAWDDANASLDSIEALNAETGRLTDRDLEVMRYIAAGDYGKWCVARGMSDNADHQRLLAELFAADGHYSNAFTEYQALGDTDNARAMLAALADAGEHGQWLLEAYQSLGDEEGMRAEAAWMLENGKYEQAYEAYEALNDAEGMAATMEADGDSGAGFRLAVKAGDIQRAGELLDRMLEQNVPLFDENDRGGLLYGEEISNLLAMNSDGADALAQRLADGVVEGCRAMLAQRDNYEAWNALNGLHDSAEPLWTEDCETLRDSCVEPMPTESFVLRDKDALAQMNAGGGTATIHVYNESGRPLILGMVNLERGIGVWAYVAPGMYDFTVKSGRYSASVWRGDLWFGEKDAFGPDYRSTDVRVVNGRTGIAEGDRLEGSYSITVG